VANHIQNERGKGATPLHGDVAEIQKEQGTLNANSDQDQGIDDEDHDKEAIPRWRQIEIMRERAQLREALGDLDDEFGELDELEREVFGSESENETLYRHGEEDSEEELEFDDDETLDDEEFEEFDED
jgi:hypothetical protein